MDTRTGQWDVCADVLLKNSYMYRGNFRTKRGGVTDVTVVAAEGQVLMVA